MHHRRNVTKLINVCQQNVTFTDEFKKSTSYITQDDSLQLLLTVAENMKIAADLKLGDAVSEIEKNTRVSISIFDGKKLFLLMLEASKENDVT